MEAGDAPTDGRALRDIARTMRDEEIVREVCAGDCDLFEQLLRRYNQRLYRIARAVLHSNQEAEDVVQETWLRAFRHLSELAEPAHFATWVSRIALYEAWARARRSRRLGPSEPEPGAGDGVHAQASPDPERTAADREIHRVVEAAIDALPEKYRIVLVLRGIEGLSTAEAARSLSLSRVAVSTRFHRARALLRRELWARGVSGAPFAFLGARCASMRERVMACLPRTWSALEGGG